MRDYANSFAVYNPNLKYFYFDSNVIQDLPASKNKFQIMQNKTSLERPSSFMDHYKTKYNNGHILRTKYLFTSNSDVDGSDSYIVPYSIAEQKA